MKIKIIEATNECDFTISINNFIKDKKIIDIKYSRVENILRSCIYRKFSAMIIYNEE